VLGLFTASNTSFFNLTFSTASEPFNLTLISPTSVVAPAVPFPLKTPVFFKVNAPDNPFKTFLISLTVHSSPLIILLADVYTALPIPIPANDFITTGLPKTLEISFPADLIAFAAFPPCAAAPKYGTNDTASKARLPAY
jgi:hypothetical protein